MNKWSLPRLLSDLNEDIERRLEIARKSFGHPGTKGDATENVWLDVLQLYLPRRYQVASAHVVDSKGKFSDQIDVLIFDRQYSPFIFKFEGQTIVPSESVYAVFEVKQTISAATIDYARKKIQSVRRLRRTSLPIPYAAGTYPPKPLPAVLGGLLTFESEWRPPLGRPLLDALGSGSATGRLDIGCVSTYGLFTRDSSGRHIIVQHSKAATVFLLELIALLQDVATVPMVDVRAYAKWLARPKPE